MELEFTWRNRLARRIKLWTATYYLGLDRRQSDGKHMRNWVWGGRGCLLRIAERRATASGGGTKPGAEAAKTSRLVSKRRCIGVGGAGAGAATGAAGATALALALALVAPEDFLWRRRFLRDEAVSEPTGSCATGMVVGEGRIDPDMKLKFDFDMESKLSII